MDEQLAATVQSALARVKSPPCPCDFTDRVQHAIHSVRQTVPEVATCASEELTLMVAMILLGPPAHKAGPPPEAQQQELRGLLHHYGSDRFDEMATAYGCGFGRTLATGEGISWRHRWPNAINHLTRRVVLPAVKQVHQFLTKLNIHGYPEERSPGELNKDANLLTVKFVQGASSTNCMHPEVGRVHSAWQGGIEVTLNAKGIGTQCAPPGSRILFTPTNALQVGLEGAWKKDVAANARVKILARDEDAYLYPGGKAFCKVPGGATATLSGPATIHVWRCTCGWENCEQQHRLTSWDPARHSLWNFTSNAIIGPTAFPNPKKKKRATSAKAKATPKVGSLVCGMYLPHLIHEEWLMPRLRVVDVEFNFCRCGTKYEGEKCPGCNEPFDPARVQRLPRLWLIAFADAIPQYEFTIRYRCQRRVDHFRRFHEFDDEKPVSDEVTGSPKWDNYCESPADPAATPRCPLCGNEVEPKKSHMWKRLFPHTDSLDDPNFEPHRLVTDTKRRKPKPRRDSHD